MTKGTHNTQLLLNGEFEDFAIDYRIVGDEIEIQKIYNRTRNRVVKDSFFFLLVDRSDIIHEIMDEHSGRVYDEYLNAQEWGGEER